jgi:hypothetical protein
MNQEKQDEVQGMAERIGGKRFYRVNIVDPDGSIVGDSGWVKNYVTNLGLQHYLAELLVGQANSKRLGYLALGTGGLPTSTDTTLAGELMASTKRVAIGANTAFSSRSSSNGSCTLFLYGTFTASFCTAAASISNVGLYAATTTNDTLFSGATYSSSQLNTNQAVQVTYQIQLG